MGNLDVVVSLNEVLLWRFNNIIAIFPDASPRRHELSRGVRGCSRRAILEDDQYFNTLVELEHHFMISVL